VSSTAHALTKLTAARVRLILERPFIGALVMHLPLEAASADWCDTIATDARSFYFNPRYVDKLDFAETQFVLAHCALHCALGHFARRAHRTLRRWDVACDNAVNLLLLDDGLKMPAGALAVTGYRGLSAEEIYPLIPAGGLDRTLDVHAADLAGMKSSLSTTAGSWRRQDEQDSAAELTSIEESDTWDDAGNERAKGPRLARRPLEVQAGEREALAMKWRGRMAAARQHARQVGRLSASWTRLVDELIEPALPWRVLLARFMMSAARDDYSYQRLSRREGPAVMPRLATGEVDVCIAIDTSGSIQQSALAEFTAEVDSLKSQIRARVTVLACDERLDTRSPWTFQAWEPVSLPTTFSGGGGTTFVPVFEWIAGTQYRPDVLVYLTDAEGEFPPIAPDYPVIWLVKGKAGVPWGERIQLN
jgi:predicted metal-dependent peptidase